MDMSGKLQHIQNIQQQSAPEGEPLTENKHMNVLPFSSQTVHSPDVEQLSSENVQEEAVDVPQENVEPSQEQQTVASVSDSVSSTTSFSSSQKVVPEAAVDVQSCSTENNSVSEKRDPSGDRDLITPLRSSTTTTPKAPEFIISTVSSGPGSISRSDAVGKLYRKVRRILNKLTPEKFQTLVKQILDLDIDTEEQLKGVANLVYEKAINEPRFSAMYANMCRYLTKVKVLSQSKSGYVSFRAILLTRCQREFEKDWQAELQKIRKEINENAEENKELKVQFEMKKSKAKKQSIGNIRFIGELFKVKMLTENIMHDCLFKLLRAKYEESLECVCLLLLTIGKELDTDKAKPRMDQYFNQIEKIVSEREASSLKNMLQDVIELRLNNWERRRDDYPNSQHFGGFGGRQGLIGWRVERQYIEPSGLKFSKPNVDESNIKFGPDSGASRFSGWQRGSTGREARDSSTLCSRKTKYENHSFAASPAKGASSRCSQDAVCQTPTKDMSDGSSRKQERCLLEVEEVEKPTVFHSSNEMEKKTITILDEYLHTQDMKKAILSVEELSSPSTMHVFVSAALNHVIDLSEKARNQTGLLLHDLIKKNILSVDCYVKGLTGILLFAEDMEFDIPKIWQFFGELIGPMVQDGSVPLQFLRQAAEPLKPSGKSGLLVAKVLHAASHREGHKKVGLLWRQSSLQWNEFMPAEQVHQFVKDNKIEFTEGDGSQPSPPTVSKSIESIHEKLDDLLRENSDNEGIFDWIEENVDDPTTKSRKFVRALMTTVCQSSITGSGHIARVVPDTVKNRGVLLQKYLDHQTEFELQALYAVQALAHKLDHPPGVLRTLFDTLYDEDIISEDAFNQWEKSSDPAEQEGKEVAMKQVQDRFNGNEGGKNDDVTFIKYDAARKHPGKQKQIKDEENCNSEVILHKADFPWKPRFWVEKQRNAETLYRKVFSILKMLASRSFKTLVKLMLDLYIDTEEKLRGVTVLIYEKAVREPKFSVLCASLCTHLTVVKVPLQSESGYVDFRAMLLRRCQREFQRDWQAELQQIEKEISEHEENGELKAHLEMEKEKARGRSIGNIRFIGELFKLKMLTKRIMHDCVYKLLRDKDEMSLERVCNLLINIGKELDTDTDKNAKSRMDQYFNRMRKIVSEKMTSSRVGFKLEYVIELRHNNWLPRRDGSKPIAMAQNHTQTEQEVQVNEQQKTTSGWCGGEQKYRGFTRSEITEPMEFTQESNTNSEKNVRFEILSIDPSKFSQQTLNGSTAQPDGGVDVSRFHGRDNHDKENTKFERLIIDPSRLKFLEATLNGSTAQPDYGFDVKRSHARDSHDKENTKFERLIIDPSRLEQTLNGPTTQPYGGIDVKKFHARDSHDKENTKFERLIIDPSRLKFLEQNLH